MLGKPISLFSLFLTSSLWFLFPSRAVSSGQDVKVCKDSGKTQKQSHGGAANALKVN